MLDSSTGITTGIISGTPVSYAKSGYKITLTATNDAGNKSKKIPLKVNGKASKITAKLPQATAGENYSEALFLNSVKSFNITVYASNPVKEEEKKNYTVIAVNIEQVFTGM